MICTEESAFGYGLAPFVGRAWEEAFHTSLLPSQRSVVLRTSFVLGRNRGAGGGALDKLRMLARMGLGGKVGNGTQGISWIHEADMNRLFERGLRRREMMRTLAFDGLSHPTLMLQVAISSFADSSWVLSLRTV